MRMKKLVAVFASIFALILCMGMLAGCGGEKHTVTFYDGGTVLKTVYVSDGEKVENYTPTKEGYTFIDWYATPRMNKEFDFDAAITEDKSVFSNWKSAVFVKDEREWTIAGESSVGGKLKDSDWGKKNKSSFLLTRKSDTTNEFSMTLDLYPGDKFQVIDIDEDDVWKSQRGYGYVKSNSTDWKGSGTGYGETDSLRQNIEMLNAGNYTVVLTTEVGNSTLDLITFTRNGNAEKDIRLTLKPNIAGTLSGGNAYTADKLGDLELQLNNTTKKYETTVSLNVNDYFSILPTIGGWGYAIRTATADASASGCIDTTEKGNIKVTVAGKYKIQAEIELTADQYKIASSKITLSKVGEFERTAGDNEIQYVYGSGDSKNYSAYVRKDARVPESKPAPSQENKTFIGWYDSNSKPLNINEPLAATGQTISYSPKFLGAGDTDSRSVFLSGSFNGWAKNDNNYKMTVNQTSHTYNLVIDDSKLNGECMFKIYDAATDTGATLNMKNVDKVNSTDAITGDSNIKFTQKGTYTITYNALTNKILITKA